MIDQILTSNIGIYMKVEEHGIERILWSLLDLEFDVGNWPSIKSIDQAGSQYWLNMVNTGHKYASPEWWWVLHVHLSYL